jgi:hypothetical protein
MANKPMFWRFMEAVAPDYALTLKEAASPGTADVDGTAGFGFRKLTDSKREIPDFNRERALKIVRYLAKSNPLAYRGLELTADFVWGDGFTPIARDEDVQKILDGNWDDPSNAWDLKGKSRAHELSLSGEWLFEMKVTPENGRVRIRVIPPECIGEMEVTDIARDEVKSVMVTEEKGEERWLQVIQKREDPNSPLGYAFSKLEPGAATKEGIPYAGECFLFRINRLIGELNGSSDLLPVADWIDALDSFLFNAIERSALLNAFIIDVEIQNTSQTYLEKRRAEIEAHPPRPGRVNIRTPQEKWTFMTPTFAASDHEVMAKMIRHIIVAGMGLAETWFGTGESTNRASAVEMGTPIFRRLKSRQFYIESALRLILEHQLFHSINAKRITTTAVNEQGQTVTRDFTFQVIPAEISPKDHRDDAVILGEVVAALESARVAGHITDEETERAVRRAAQPFGVQEERPDAEKKPNRNPFDLAASFLVEKYGISRSQAIEAIEVASKSPKEAADMVTDLTRRK